MSRDGIGIRANGCGIAAFQNRWLARGYRLHRPNSLLRGFRMAIRHRSCLVNIPFITRAGRRGMGFNDSPLEITEPVAPATVGLGAALVPQITSGVP
jgi:hypothetical protein